MRVRTQTSLELMLLLLISLIISGTFINSFTKTIQIQEKVKLNEKAKALVFYSYCSIAYLNGERFSMKLLSKPKGKCFAKTKITSKGIEVKPNRIWFK